MRNDTQTTLYMVRKINENTRRVTSYEEQYRVLRDQGNKMDMYVDISTIDGVEQFANLKKEVVVDEKTPLKIFEENDMYYYLSPDETKGVVFLQEEDAQQLFLEVEKTLENMKEHEYTNSAKSR